MGHALVEQVGLFLLGLLAGEEFAINAGIRVLLARLETSVHIRARQELIRTLRILVPFLFAAALGFQILAAAVTPGGRMMAMHLVAIALLFAFIMVTLLGTVPINKAVLEWNPQQPPPGWQDSIRRWELLDLVRTILAIAAFVAALATSGPA